MNVERDLDIFKYLLEHINVIVNHIDGYDEDLFLRDTKTKDAVLTRLIAIGEYSFRIDDKTRARFADIDWRSI